MHIHGAPSIKRVLEASPGLPFVVAGFDLPQPTARGYRKTFYPKGMLAAWLGKTERAVAQALQVKAVKFQPLVLSAWSAGVAALERISRDPLAKDAGLILLDGTHAGLRFGPNGSTRAKRLETSHLQWLVGRARSAIKGKGFLYLSHSKVPTDDYGSTRETTDWLLRELALSPQEGSGDGRLYRWADKGGFQLRGFAGQDEAAHCDQLRHISDGLSHYLEYLKRKNRSDTETKPPKKLGGQPSTGNLPIRDPTSASHQR